MRRLGKMHKAALRVSVVAAMLVTVAAVLPASGEAETFPKLVYGYVWDSAGTPLAGADITVNMKRPDTSIRSTMTDTTDSLGQYLVSFDPADWELGDTIQVIAEYNGNQQDNSSLPLTHEDPQWVNITYDFAIPEFGSTIGLLISGGLIGLVAVVALVYFKKR